MDYCRAFLWKRIQNIDCLGTFGSLLRQHMVTNMHDEVVGVRNDQVEVVWQVQGRGKVR